MMKILVRLTKFRSFNTNVRCFAASMSSRNQIILTGERCDKKQYIILIDNAGKVIKEIISKWRDGVYHYEYRRATEHPTDSNYIVESCLQCEKIRSYNIQSDEGNIIHDKVKPLNMCTGPNQTLLVLNERKHLLQLQWNDEKKKLERIYSTEIGVIDSVCYLKQERMCVFASYDRNSITAVRYPDNSVMWGMSQ